MGRFALVIGNATYKAPARALKTPIDDSIEVSDVLKKVGFDVSQEVDCDRRAMRRNIKDFNTKISAARAEVALLYYSGHACQVGQDNWLLATDSKIEDLSDLEAEATLLSRQVQAMRERAKVTLVFLDACRDYPFAGSDTEAAGGRGAVGSGLAEMPVPEGPVGKSLIAFAAEEGRTADDGEGLSPFTKAFIEHVAIPGLSIAELLMAVRMAVEEATGGKQSPRDYSGLTQPFFFVPAAKPPIDNPGSDEVARVNDLVVLFGGQQSEGSDFASFKALADALAPARDETRAVVEPWPKGKSPLAWNDDLENKLRSAKTPLLVEFRTRNEGVAKDGRLRNYLYASAGAQAGREGEFYDRSNQMLGAAEVAERWIWKPDGSPGDVGLADVRVDAPAVLAPSILRRLGFVRHSDAVLPRVAADLAQVIGAPFVRDLGHIVGVENEPEWSQAVRWFSFKRPAGGGDRLQDEVAKRFAAGQANIIGTCARNGDNTQIKAFLNGIDSRIVEGQRSAIRDRGVTKPLCIVKYVARVVDMDEGDDAIPPEQEETAEPWFVLKYARVSDAAYGLRNRAEARDWLKDSADRYGISID